MKKIAFLLILPIWLNGQNPLDNSSLRRACKNGETIEVSTDTIILGSTDQLSLFFSERSIDTAYTYELRDTTRLNVVKADTVPLVYYSNLRPGLYSLNVTAKTLEGDLAISNLTIIVHDYWTNNLWLFLQLGLYMTLLLGGAIFFIRVSNSRNKEKLTDLRSDWTNKLHNDIGGDLSSVSLRLDILKKKIEPLDDSIKTSVLKTYEILRIIQKKLRFVFDLVDPKKDSLLVMLADVRDFAAENYAMQNIAFEYKNGIAPEASDKIDIGRVNKLYLAIKEAVNNSVKNSEATQASLTIQQKRKGLLIEIKDNGKGFDPSRKHNGNGLENLKAYSREGLIDVSINSKPGAGTKVRMFVPHL